MNIQTETVIRNIAEIQIEALKRIKEDPTLQDELILKLLQVPEGDVTDSIDGHIDMYNQISENPYLIKMLTEYQLMVCSHILFRMEDEWFDESSLGVQEAWQIIDKAYSKFHPEFSLLSI